MSDKLFAEAVAAETSLAGALRRLQLATSGRTYTSGRARIRRLELDTSHFVNGTALRSEQARLGANELLVLGAPGSRRRPAHLLRRALLELGVPETCTACGLEACWQGKPLRLDIDHVNGQPHDNRRRNLRFLCPNCHRQTSTWGSRKVVRRCADCGAPITKNATRCPQDSIRARERTTKIAWPTIAELEDLLASMSREAVGRQLGVTGAAVKKHLLREQALLSTDPTRDKVAHAA